jgi:hypothetical protein
MESSIPDTLVLKIAERDQVTDKLDTTLYILYDISKGLYVIRGNRAETRKCNSLSYSFECDSLKRLVDFIEFVVDDDASISYILYNCDNLPALSDDITHEHLSNASFLSNEIAGYDNQTFNRKYVTKLIRVLSHVFNDNH